MINIYTDGACSGNPGIGGWGVVILDNNKDMSAVTTLHNLNDIDRNLISCEGRSYIGKWLHLSPK